MDDEETATYSLTSRSSIPIEADRTALLIVDVQPGTSNGEKEWICRGSKSTDPYMTPFHFGSRDCKEYWSECPVVRQDFPHFPSRISSLVSHCRSQGTKCIWVRADYNFEKSPWLQQFSRLHQGRIPPIVKPNSRWESFAEPRGDEFVMTKSSWSSTSQTELLDVLRESGIDTVLVCGLITSVCVQHSAFGIFEAGFRTILVTDACADRGKSRHEAALALYGDYMYELRTVESVREELKSSSSSPPLGNENDCVVSTTTVKPVTSHESLNTLQTAVPSDSEASDTESYDDNRQPSTSRTRYVSVAAREFATNSMA